MNDRRTLLIAALGFLQLGSQGRALTALHAWLDAWSGIGLIVIGMDRQGYAVSLRKVHGGGWVASFDRDPMLASSGFGSGPTPWLATQRAAWAAVKRRSE